MSHIVQFHVYEMSRISRFIETERRLVVARDAREVGMGIDYLMNMRFLFVVIKKSLELDSGDWYTTF